LNVQSTGIDYLPAGPPISPAWLVSASGRELDLSEFLRNKVEVFFQVTRGSQLLYRSEFVGNAKDASWQPFILNLRDLGSIDNPFTVSVYDADESKRGAHKLVGHAHCNMREWLFNLPWDEALVHPDKKWRVNYQSSGAFRLNSVQPIGAEKVTPIPRALELRVTGHALDSKDLLGKSGAKIQKKIQKNFFFDYMLIISLFSDPFFVIKNSNNLILWRSEVQKQTLNPDWSNKPCAIGLDMVGGYTAPFVIECYDWNPDGLPDLIGVLKTNMQAINQGRPHNFALLHPDKVGMVRYFSSGGVTIQSKPIDVLPTFAPAFKFDISATKLDGKDGPLAKSDPYLEIKAKPVGFPEYMTVWRSNVCPKTLDAKWNSFVFSVAEAGGYDAPIHLVVSDFDSDGQHDLIGVVRTSSSFTLSFDSTQPR